MRNLSFITPQLHDADGIVYALREVLLQFVAFSETDCAVICMRYGLWDYLQQVVEKNIPQQRFENVALDYVAVMSHSEEHFPFTKTLGVLSFRELMMKFRKSSSIP